MNKSVVKANSLFQFLCLLVMSFCFNNLQAQQPKKWKLRFKQKVELHKHKADSLYLVADSIVKERRVGERIDSIIDIRQSKYNFDTRYISKPAARWTFKVRLNLAGAHIGSREQRDGVRSTINLNTEVKSTVSFGVSYRGISVGFGMNPAKLFKKKSDFELNINSYAQKYGFDLTFLRANSFSGEAKIGDSKFDIERGIVNQTMFSANAYYAFNYKRFSYAAAFSQSFDQKRSAGSFLLGLSFLAMRTKHDGSEELGLPPMRIYMGHFGLGAGYGHNFVLPHNWLVHVSSLPTIVIINRSNITEDGVRKKMPYYFPSVITTGHVAVIHYFKRYFAGFTAVVNTSVVGRRDNLQLINTKWRTRLVFGIRI